MTVVVLEVIGIYIVISYASDIDAYGVLVCLGIRMLSVLGSANRFCSIMLYILMWPFMLTYVMWMEKIMPRLKLNESFKKLLILCVCSIIATISLMWLYVFGLLRSYRLISVVPLGVYVFLVLMMGIWFLLIIYVIFGVFINVNYRFMLLGLLPLPTFFVKLCGNWVLLYVIIIMGIILLL